MTISTTTMCMFLSRFILLLFLHFIPLALLRQRYLLTCTIITSLCSRRFSRFLPLFLSAAYLFLRDVPCAFCLSLSSKDGGFKSLWLRLKFYVLDSRNVTDVEMYRLCSPATLRSLLRLFSSLQPHIRFFFLHFFISSYYCSYVDWSW